jgi:hypothetical protein
MIYPDIKSYFLEAEIDNGADSDFINDIEKSRSVEELIQIVSDWNNMDEFEASHYILTTTCK